MKPRERDLRHDADPVRFAAAMSQCEAGSDACSRHGMCEKGGECFVSPPHLVAARMVERLITKEGRAGVHYAYLRRCVELLRADRIEL